MPHVVVKRRKIEFAWIEGDPARPVLVFLHEGLGSIRLWRDFPAQVAAETGCRALVYDRYGYGDSDVLEEAGVGADFMHREALDFLPDLLSVLDIRQPLLFGHSDGASIALIHAAAHPVRALALMAPHVFVEPICVDSIAAIRRDFEASGLKARLAKYHRDPGKTFHLWADAWLGPAFPDWNIEACLPKIRCPVLAIQGESDQYGTMAQLDAIARQVAGACELLKLADCGHSPQRDKPAEVLAAVADFVKRLA